MKKTIPRTATGGEVVNMSCDVFAGRLNEMMSAIGFDGEVAGCLSNFVVHHADQLAQAMNATSALPAAATG